MQDQDEGILQQQVQKEEQQREKVSSDKARVDTLALNIKHWRSRAREAHECFTCRRKLNAAEMVTFMQIQASPLAALCADLHPVSMGPSSADRTDEQCITSAHHVNYGPVTDMGGNLAFRAWPHRQGKPVL